MMMLMTMRKEDLLQMSSLSQLLLSEERSPRPKLQRESRKKM